MLFRYSVRHKLGTILHELSHRILLEYKLNYAGILNNDHELIDLFLFDVIKIAFGEAAARQRVDYEKTFPDPEFKQAWNFALSFSFKERQELLKQILDQNKSQIEKFLLTLNQGGHL